MQKASTNINLNYYIYIYRYCLEEKRINNYTLSVGVYLLKLIFTFVMFLKLDCLYKKKQSNFL